MARQSAAAVVKTLKPNELEEGNDQNETHKKQQSCVAESWHSPDLTKCVRARH